MNSRVLAPAGPLAAPSGQGLWSLAWARFRRHRMALCGLAVLALVAGGAVLAPAITPYSPTALDPDHSLAPPSRQHLLGTDDLGRDEFSRVVYGGRVSLLVGLTAMLVGSAIGVVLGSVAGYAGGGVDTLVLRRVDVLRSCVGFSRTRAVINWLGGQLQRVDA